MHSLAHDMSGSRQARFHALLEQHRGIVLKVAHTYSRDPDDRADLCQEIAIQLWRSFAGYDPARPFSTWMYRIALNVAISFLRNQERRRQHLPLSEQHAELAGSQGSSYESSEQLRLLQRFLAGLDPLNRALMLLYLEERPYREMADILGISETNVATKINRLKLRIRAELDPPVSN